MKVRPVRLPYGGRKESPSPVALEQINESMYRITGELSLSPADVLYYKRIKHPPEKSEDPIAHPRKIVTVTLSLEPIDGAYDSDELIASDIEQELSCCWHSFDVLSIEIEDEKGANHAE